MAHRDDCAPGQADNTDGDHTPSIRLAPGAATVHHGPEPLAPLIEAEYTTAPLL